MPFCCRIKISCAEIASALFFLLPFPFDFSSRHFSSSTFLECSNSFDVLISNGYCFSRKYRVMMLTLLESESGSYSSACLFSSTFLTLITKVGRYLSSSPAGISSISLLSFFLARKSCKRNVTIYYSRSFILISQQGRSLGGGYGSRNPLYVNIFWSFLPKP